MTAICTHLDQSTHSVPRAYAQCADRLAGESLPEYASRVLRYAITYGIEPLSISQLELADATAQACVSSFPQTLSPDEARQDAALHALRLRMQARVAGKHAQLASLQRLIDSAWVDSREAANASHNATDTVEMSDQERALQLLRAALTLIMQPPDDRSGGGRGARLIAPKPTQPPGSNALPAPAAPAGRSRF